MYFKLRKLKLDDKKYEVLKLKLNKYKRILRKSIKLAKYTYYYENFNNSKDMKKTWCLIKEALGKQTTKQSFSEYLISPSGNTLTGNSWMPKWLLRYPFVGTLLTKSEAEIENTHSNNSNIIPKASINIFNFSAVTEKQVADAINNLRRKNSFGTDGVSTKILKFVKSEICSSLTHIFNGCISKSEFPDVLKIARVIPLFKKGDPHIMNNYRPISLLPAFSKIFERLLHDQINHFFENYNLFSEGQYGFRKGRSTDLAGAHLINFILNNRHKGNKSVGIFIDFSKAFARLTIQYC